MDGVGSTHGGVLVLGATNVPWELDPGNLFCLLFVAMFSLSVKKIPTFRH